MGQTIYIGDAWNIIRPHVPRAVEDNFASIAANMAITEMWDAYDFRETIDELPPFYLIPGEQDYGHPIYAVPTNFGGMRMANLVCLNSTRPERREIHPRRDLRRTSLAGMPELIGFDVATKKIRVYPRVPDNIAGSDFMIEGTYKKEPAQVTPATIHSTLIPWDDKYLSVFLAALKWAAWDIAADQRAEKQYLFLQHLLQKMAADEGLDLGDPPIAPAEPLVGGNYGF